MAYAGAGIFLMVLLVGFDYRLLANLAGLLYALAIGALLVVLVLGRLHYGAQRWIDLGFFQLQPSEPAKLLVAVALARYFAVNRERIHRLRTIVISLAIAGLPFGLTLVEPDLGTALVFLAIWFGTAYAAGVRWRHIGLLAAGTALAVPIGWQMVPGYMRSRVLIFLDPYSDPLDKGY